MVWMGAGGLPTQPAPPALMRGAPARPARRCWPATGSCWALTPDPYTRRCWPATGSSWARVRSGTPGWGTSPARLCMGTTRETGWTRGEAPPGWSTPGWGTSRVDLHTGTARGTRVEADRESRGQAPSRRAAQRSAGADGARCPWPACSTPLAGVFCLRACSPRCLHPFGPPPTSPPPPPIPAALSCVPTRTRASLAC